MKNRLIITLFLAIGLSGCAAGMVGVHQGNIDAYTTLIVKLGPKEQDTANEAKEREMWAAELKKSLDALSEYQPQNAEEQRKKLEYTLDVEL
jgi:hypothetical protein